MMKNIKLSSVSKEWYSPKHIVESSRKVLGAIEFDPASCLQANELIKAKSFLSEKSLESFWPQDVSIYLNSPGGRVGNKSQAALFWDKLFQHRNQGHVKHAIVICFSLEIFQTSQQYYPITNFPFCIPAKRLKYWQPEGNPRSPTHASAIVYLPGTVDKTEEFAKEFSQYGNLLNCYG